MDYSMNFWDRMAERYAKTPVPDESEYQRKLAIAQKYFRPHMNVFEFGCGTGSTAIIHAPHIQNYHAIDVSSNMIKIANRKLADTEINNLKFSVSSLEEFDAVTAPYDAVLGMSILHLLNDHEAAIRQIYTLLKPGGIFVTSTACIADFMPWFRYIAPVGTLLRLMPMVRIFSKQDLENSMIQAGFNIDRRLSSPRKAGGYFLVAVKPS